MRRSRPSSVPPSFVGRDRGRRSPPHSSKSESKHSTQGCVDNEAMAQGGTCPTAITWHPELVLELEHPSSWPDAESARRARPCESAALFNQDLHSDFPRIKAGAGRFTAREGSRAGTEADRAERPAVTVRGSRRLARRDGAIVARGSLLSRRTPCVALSRLLPPKHRLRGRRSAVVEAAPVGGPRAPPRGAPGGLAAGRRARPRCRRRGRPSSARSSASPRSWVSP